MTRCLEPDPDWHRSLFFKSCISISLLVALDTEQEEIERTGIAYHPRVSRGESSGLELAGDEGQIGVRRRNGSRHEK